MTARTLASALAAAALAGAAVLGTAAPATAQEYPPAQEGVISDSTVVAGQTVTVEVGPGTFAPEITVTVTVPGLDVSGTTESAADGGAEFSFTVPSDAPTGTFEVVFTGGGTTVAVPFEVVGAAAAPVQEVDQVEQGSALPRTGADQVIPLTIGGVVLVAVGGGMVVAARRRRDTLPTSLA